MDGVGVKIKKLREKMGLSQEKFVAKCEISKQTLYLIETGKFDNPSIKTLSKIANVLGITLDELLKQ